MSNSLQPHGCSPPSSSIRGILQARRLEWAAVSSSRASSRPKNQTRSPALRADSLMSEPCLILKNTLLASVGFIVTSWWLSGKEFACQCRIPRFEPCVGKILWRMKWQPTSVFLPGKSHGQRNLVGHNPWGRKELDMTERLSMHTHTFIYV